MKQARAGELDTLVSSCLDIDQSPLTGDRCSASFLTCLRVPERVGAGASPADAAGLARLVTGRPLALENHALRTQLDQAGNITSLRPITAQPVQHH